MRKFLNFFIILFLLVALGLIFWENKNYLFGKPTLVSRAEDTMIYYGKEKIHLNGMNLDSVKPGYLPGNYAATEEDYKEWFDEIAALKVNCLKVKSIMPSRFYEALKSYNEKHRHPLLLIQGINITNQDIDQESLKKDKKVINKEIERRLKDTVDVIHGNKTPIFSKNIKEMYTSDVSPYTIAYSVDSSLDYADIIYSEIVNDKNKDYTHDFIVPTKEASNTEKFFAKVSNDVMQYEDHRYQTQRLMTVQGSRSDVIEALKMSQDGKKESGRKRYIDIHHLKTTNRVKSGLVASYSLNLENNESLDYKGGLQEQLSLLKKYNRHIPILISEYAVPNTRVGDNYSANTSEGKINEEKQAENLIKILDIIKKENLCGQFLLEWQDSWYRSTWNIKDVVQRNRTKYWNNPLSYSQHYGLLSFDTSQMYPDGKLDEWKEIKPITKMKGISLSIQQDETYLMLLLKSESQLPDDISIAFDITPQSGSKKADDISYQRPVDFVAHLGKNQGVMKVQRYYNATRFEQNRQKLHQNPNFKEKHSADQFDEETIKVQNRYYSRMKQEFMPDKYASIGQLIVGNGNPKQSDFNSNTDYYRNDKVIEWRIPWQMLNFYDPSQCKIIADMYQNRSIRPKRIEDIYVEAKVGSKILGPGKYQLQSWGMPTYQPRLKQSYYILKDYFSKEES